MFLRNRIKNPDIIMALGCVALAAANITQFLLRRSAALPESTADGLSGFLFGIGIATLLLSIVLRTRRNEGSGCSS